MNNCAYTALTSTFTRIYRYQHLGAFVGWDQAAMMPPKGNEARGVSPYDALMDKYEPGTRSSDIDAIFTEVKSWLPDLIGRVREQQASEPVIEAQGPFAIERQRALGLDLMQSTQVKPKRL